MITKLGKIVVSVLCLPIALLLNENDRPHGPVIFVEEQCCNLQTTKRSAA
jgi:hypothetical protein